MIYALLALCAVVAFQSFVIWQMLQNFIKMPKTTEYVPFPSEPRVYTPFEYLPVDPERPSIVDTAHSNKPEGAPPLPLGI